MTETNQTGIECIDDGVNIIAGLPPDTELLTKSISHIWDHQDFMDWRTQSLTLDRDRDYPRFSTEHYRRRWHWEAGEFAGDAAFAATALVAALRANNAQSPSLYRMFRDSIKVNKSTKPYSSVE